MALPPGPRTPALVQTAQWALGPTRFLESCWRCHGDVFTLRLLSIGPRGATPVVFVVDPEIARQVLQGPAAIFRAGASRIGLEPIFGSHSILLLDEADHLRQRKLMLPPFQAHSFGRYGEIIVEETLRETDGWPLGKEPFALQPSMQRITLEVILRAVLGLEDPARRSEVRRPLLGLLKAISNPWVELGAVLPPRIGPINLRYGFERLMGKVDRVLCEEVTARRRNGRDGGSDVLSLLIAARDENDRGMSDEEIRDELVTLLLAGHETTAIGLAWTFDYLVHHPDVVDRVVQDCEQCESGGPYLDAVVKESLRLRPPLPIADRMLSEPYEINGHEIPPGVILATCIYLIHRRGDAYPHPAAFCPERFLNDPPPTFSWLPFGGGIRRCLGGAFAVFEMKLVLATILKGFILEAAEPEPEAARRRAIVLGPKHGTRVIARNR